MSLYEKLPAKWPLWPEKAPAEINWQYAFIINEAEKWNSGLYNDVKTACYIVIEIYWYNENIVSAIKSIQYRNTVWSYHEEAWEKLLY